MMESAGRLSLGKTTVKGRRISLAVALVLLLVAIAPGPATNVMLDQITGPYEITVGASPTPLKVGAGHVSVLVQKYSNALVVADAQVTVTATSLESDGTTIVQPATHEFATDHRQYGAPLTFETPGRWEIAVHVEGPEGPATAQFNVTVQPDFPAQVLSYLGLISIPLGGVLLIVYWLRSGETAARRSGETAARRSGESVAQRSGESVAQRSGGTTANDKEENQE